MPDSSTVIRAGRLLDVETGELLAAREIVVTDGRVELVRPWTEPLDDGATVIDLSAYHGAARPDRLPRAPDRRHRGLGRSVDRHERGPGGPHRRPQRGGHPARRLHDRPRRGHLSGLPRLRAARCHRRRLGGRPADAVCRRLRDRPRGRWRADRPAGRDHASGELAGRGRARRGRGSGGRRAHPRRRRRPDQGHRHRRRADARHRRQPRRGARAAHPGRGRGGSVTRGIRGRPRPRERGHQARRPGRRPVGRARLAAGRRRHRADAPTWHVLGRGHLRRRLDRRAGSARGLAGRDAGQERCHDRCPASGLHARRRSGRGHRLRHGLRRLPARPERPAVRLHGPLRHDAAGGHPLGDDRRGRAHGLVGPRRLAGARLHGRTSSRSMATRSPTSPSSSDRRPSSRAVRLIESERRSSSGS